MDSGSVVPGYAASVAAASWRWHSSLSFARGFDMFKPIMAGGQGVKMSIALGYFFAWRGTIEIAPVGHVETQTPQPIHFVAS